MSPPGAGVCRHGAATAASGAGTGVQPPGRRTKSYNLADYPLLGQTGTGLARPGRKTILKLHPDKLPDQNVVTAYGANYVNVNKQRHETSLLLLPDGEIVSWPVTSFAAITAADFDAVVRARPEVVVFGSGARLRFLHPRVTAALTAQRIGVETMDLQAACRTFNILVAEGRRVAAVLLLEPAA
jgi:uncharacterized protein